VADVSSGHFVGVNDTDLINVFGNTYNNSDDMLMALKSGLTTSEAASGRSAVALRRMAGSRESLSHRKHTMSRSLLLQLVPGSMGGASTGGIGGGTGFSFNILTPSSSSASALKNVLTSLTSNDYNSLLSTVASVSGETNTSISASIITDSVRLIFIQHRTGAWALFLDFLKRNIMNVVGSVGGLTLFSLLLCAAKVRKRGKQIETMVRNEVLEETLREIRLEQRWRLIRMHWRRILRKLGMVQIFTKLLSAIRSRRDAAVRALAGKGGEFSLSLSQMAAKRKPIALGRGVALEARKTTTESKAKAASAIQHSRTARARVREILQIVPQKQKRWPGVSFEKGPSSQSPKHTTDTHTSLDIGDPFMDDSAGRRLTSNPDTLAAFLPQGTQ